MLKTLKVFLLSLLISNLYALEINESSSDIDILANSKILITSAQSKDIKDIQNKKFSNNSESVLGLGFVPQKALWIKFTLKNTSNKKIKKSIVYENQETEKLLFYDSNKTTLDGMWNMPSNRESVYPIFNIYLEPFEQKTYYIRAYSKITTLIAKVRLYTDKEAMKTDFKNKAYIFMFFASILILLIYNTMLLLFTKDKTYLYYTLYLVAVIIFESIYLGVAQLYIFSNEVSEIITKATITYISILTVPIVMFTREFLETQSFKKHDLIFRSYLYAIPFLCVLSYDDIVFNQNIMLVFIPLGFVLISVGVLALFSGVRQAKFYIIGWTVLIISLVLSVIESYGYLSISDELTYKNEFSFIFEALLFSIALAHRIKILNEQKSELDAQLIQFQKDEKQKLKELVDKKTEDLQKSLEEKELLYKELNHRVKNNLSMILSLIKLQISKSKNMQTKHELNVTKNRIDSIAKLYKDLNYNQTSSKTSTKDYFCNIEDNIRLNLDKNIEVSHTIECNLNFQQLVYCGLIVNELLTNSFKHAFKDQNICKISISLIKKDNICELIVEDNGSGFKENQEDSLGLTIVKTLAERQLYGTIDIESENGTKTTIRWEIENG